MKDLIDKFNLFIGKEITETRMASEYEDWGTRERKYITRVGNIVDITDNLIVVKFIIVGANGVIRRNEIECFNKGDIISRGISVEKASNKLIKLKPYELIL